MNGKCNEKDGHEKDQIDKIDVVIVEPDRTPYFASIDRTLEGMQKVVGGLIEQVCPFDDPVSLICNEEGKLEGLPLNRTLRDEDGVIYDVIAGTFFMAYTPPDSDRFESMPKDLADKYMEIFRYPELVVMVNGQLDSVRFMPEKGKVS